MVFVHHGTGMCSKLLEYLLGTSIVYCILNPWKSGE